MKLSIVKVDGSNVDVLMNDRQPSLDKLNNELLFFENYQYRIIVRDNDYDEDIELFVGDYSISLHYNTLTDCYESDLDLIFGGCFDLTNFTLYINGENEEKIYYTDFLRVATTKQTAKQVEEMLSEIETNLPNFLEVCFSRNRKRSGLIQNDIRSIWNTLKLLNEIIEVYEENYSYFLNHKKTSVERVASIVDARDMRAIDQESLRWIACNPDNLIYTDRDLGIVVDNKNYIPSKVKTYLSQYSYEIYENKVILGFLQNILEFLDNQISDFNKEIAELDNIPETIIAQLPNTHDLTGRCVYVYYKGIIKCFEEKKSIVQEIFYRYEIALECSEEIICGIPKLTNTFKQVYHYRMCYECMVKWFEAGDYAFEHLNYLFKLKTLSRIFEYFCLIKIQNALTQLGYVFQNSKRIIYDIENDTEDINNHYLFSGNGYEITLLYEPTIWTNKINEYMNLYSTGYNFSKSKWNEKWTPDFVMKIVTEHAEYYYILDAKYSNAQNVKKCYILDLVLKYSTQIASKDKFFSDVIGIGALYPESEDKIYYFKKNKVNSKRQSLPKYFSLTIIGGRAGDQALKRRLDELLKVVEEIENEKEVIKSQVSDQQMLAQVKVDNPKQSKSLKALSIEKVVDVGENKYDNDVTFPVVKVNGKRCLYNAKSMCMNQRTRCNIVDAPCEHYVPKNSTDLLKEEDTCRNFIRYTRKGKVQRVECAISGMPGCIGTDVCKFCLKKNKSKKQ